MEMNQQKGFWEQKTLHELDPHEWESLCDGCGKCCLNKLEDEDTGEIYFTSVSCKYLDKKMCQCTAYQKRSRVVKDCVRLTPKKVPTISWLPKTCSYRLVHEKKPLPPWHHLVSGSRSTIHKYGMSVKGKILSETVPVPTCSYG